MSRRPPYRWCLTALVVASLVLAGAVAIAGAAPPPRSVCEPCHEDLEYAAEREGVAMDVTGSAATVRVHRNGSATWHVTSHFGPSDDRGDPNVERRNASALGDDPELARTVALRAIGEYHGSDPNVERLRSVRANGSAISFAFHDPHVARTAVGGVLLFDAFHTRGHGSGWYVDVTRLRIVGPAGTTIANGAEGAIGAGIATATDRTLVLRGDAADPPSFRRDDVYVAFARPGVAAGPLSELGILLATLPTAVGAFQAIHLPGLAVLLGVLGLGRWRAGRTDDVPDGRADDDPDGRAWRRGVAVSVAGYIAVSLLLRPPTQPPGMFWVLPAAVFVGLGVVVGLGGVLAVAVLGDGPE